MVEPIKEKEIDHEWTCCPVCPHCGEIDHDWWDYGPNELQNDGDSSERECGECGKEYTVTMSVSVHFSTVKGHEEG